MSDSFDEMGIGSSAACAVTASGSTSSTPITVTHSLRCSRCGLTGWPNEYVERLVGPWRTAEEKRR